MKYKCFGVQQPWAWLIVNGYKDIENRVWKSAYTGEILICASKRFDVAGYSWVCERAPHIEWPRVFECGGIVGKVTVTDYVHYSDSPWFVGPIGWKLSAPRVLPFQSVRGKLGLFEVEWRMT